MLQDEARNKTYTKMKKIILILMPLALVFAAFVFNACEKEESNNTQKVSDELTQMYFKEIQLADKEGINSVIIKVSSSDASILELYSSYNFEIIPVKDGQSLNEALTEYYGEQNESDQIDDNLDTEEDDSENVIPSVSFQVISKDLGDGYRNVAINYLHPDDGDERAKWRYYNHYGYEDCVTITRVSWNRRVYVGVYYKWTSSSRWSTITGTWFKLKNNESHNKCKTGSYQLKARVKAKKSGAYTIEFDD